MNSLWGNIKHELEGLFWHLGKSFANGFSYELEQQKMWRRK